MKCYEIPETKCRMHIPVYSMGTKATRQKAAFHYAVHSLSRRNLTNLMPRSFTFVCQLCFCSSKPIITKRCVLRSTLATPWVPPVCP